jgi:hypothetical protein
VALVLLPLPGVDVSVAVLQVAHARGFVVAPGAAAVMRGDAGVVTDSNQQTHRNPVSVVASKQKYRVSQKISSEKSEIHTAVVAVAVVVVVVLPEFVPIHVDQLALSALLSVLPLADVLVSVRVCKGAHA